MTDYIISFYCVGEQTAKVSNCKSKKEAIQKAKLMIDVEPIDFNVIKRLKSTYKVIAKEDR